jgi:hypothetical protein
MRRLLTFLIALAAGRICETVRADAFDRVSENNWRRDMGRLAMRCRLLHWAGRRNHMESLLVAAGL